MPDKNNITDNIIYPLPSFSLVEQVELHLPPPHCPGGTVTQCSHQSSSPASPPGSSPTHLQTLSQPSLQWCGWAGPVSHRDGGGIGGPAWRIAWWVCGAGGGLMVGLTLS